MDKYYKAALKFCQEHGYKGDRLPPFGIGPPSQVCPISMAFKEAGYDVFGSGGGTVMVNSNPGHDIIAASEASEKSLVCEFMYRADDGGYLEELGRPVWNFNEPE